MLNLVFIATLATIQLSPVKTVDQDYTTDTVSIVSTTKALYDVISGPKDQERDWKRFKNLFTPDAKMVPMFKEGDSYRSRPLTPDEYVTLAGPFLMKDGFFEKEISSKKEEYGPIAHVFSTYESRIKSKEEKPFERGINSIQLINDGKRWWVQSITWVGESTAGPLPKKYR